MKVKFVKIGKKIIIILEMLIMMKKSHLDSDERYKRMPKVNKLEIITEAISSKV